MDGLGGRAPRLGQVRGRALRPEVHLAAVKPRASRSDGRRSKNTLSEHCPHSFNKPARHHIYERVFFAREESISVLTEVDAEHTEMLFYNIIKLKYNCFTIIKQILIKLFY